jgi:hypothetical protein
MSQKTRPQTASAVPDSMATLGTLRPIPASKKYGISRTHIFAAIATGQLESYLVKRHANSRGVRLISEASLIAYIKAGGFIK